MLLWPNPFVHESQGLYGSKQESLIEFVGAVAAVINKTPLSRYPLVGIIAGGISVSCDVALYLDQHYEDEYRSNAAYQDLYSNSPTGVVYYF